MPRQVAYKASSFISIKINLLHNKCYKSKDLLMEVGKCLILCYAHEVAMKETFLGQICILILKFGFLKLGALMSEEIN